MRASPRASLAPPGSSAPGTPIRPSGRRPGDVRRSRLRRRPTPRNTQRRGSTCGPPLRYCYSLPSRPGHGIRRGAIPAIRVCWRCAISSVIRTPEEFATRPATGKPRHERPRRGECATHNHRIARQVRAVYVAANLFVYYEESNLDATVAPDVFVVLGAPNHDRHSSRRGSGRNGDGNGPNRSDNGNVRRARRRRHGSPSLRPDYVTAAAPSGRAR